MKIFTFVVGNNENKRRHTQRYKAKARELLDSYLKGTGHRHTPERSAILDAVYDQRGHFTLDELAKVLEQRNFPVSRATLYNTMRLFIKLRLVCATASLGARAMRPATPAATTSTRSAPSVEAYARWPPWK